MDENIPLNCARCVAMTKCFNILGGYTLYQHLHCIYVGIVISMCSSYIIIFITFQGKSGKYTNYSEHTGITPTKGQSTVDSPTKTSSTPMEDTASVEGLSLLIRNFANERHWNRYHTPRNIALALLGEVGELAELFQWKGDEGELELSDEERDKIGQEVADVTIYLLRLADVCHVQLGEVTMQLLTEARV